MFIGYHRASVSQRRRQRVRRKRSKTTHTQRREDSGENLVNIVLNPHFFIRSEDSGEIVPHTHRRTHTMRCTPIIKVCTRAIGTGTGRQSHSSHAVTL
jgi:hypothetical protein